MNAKHLKTTAEHNTPRAIVEAARTVLGGIDLDPMSNDAAQRVIRATTYWTKVDDCFTKSIHPPYWHGRVFLNPAGGFVKNAWQCLMRDYREGHIPAFIWIGYSLEQLQTLQHDVLDPRDPYDGPTPIEFPICIPFNRLAFEDAEGTPQTSPTHANYICYGGPLVRAFVETFCVFGAVSIPADRGWTQAVEEDPYFSVRENTDPAPPPSLY